MVPRHRGAVVVICTSMALQVWLTLHGCWIPGYGTGTCSSRCGMNRRIPGGRAERPRWTFLQEPTEHEPDGCGKNRPGGHPSKAIERAAVDLRTHDGPVIGHQQDQQEEGRR
jgi:hypothetical protein